MRGDMASVVEEDVVAATADSATRKGFAKESIEADPLVLT
jgi:hypothetical protein